MVEREPQPSGVDTAAADDQSSGDLYPHLCAAARAVVDKDNKTRIAFINQDYWIWAPKTKQIVARVQELVPIVGQTRPECVMVIADPNMGKSTIIKKIMSKNPQSWKTDNEGRHRYCPVISANVPGNPTEKTLRERIAEGIVSNSILIETYGKSGEKLYNQLALCGVSVVAFDNCQRFYNAGTKTQRTLRDMFCDLTDHGIHLAVFGSNPMVSWIKGNDHLWSRFVDEIRIKPFSDDNAHRRVLDAIEMILPLHEPSKLRDHSDLLYSGSNGRFGKIVRIARKCAIEAVSSSARSITRDMLANIIKK